ncbi:MAG: transposase [candidate division Zixibacteria bacterium]|nr:transposase [candidate division Zixibacteria bacterium]
MKLTMRLKLIPSHIAYKTKLAGVPVIVVDPRNTSRTCTSCRCVDKRNRPVQSRVASLVMLTLSLRSTSAGLLSTSRTWTPPLVLNYKPSCLLRGS